ncbi:MAG TPA: ThuA domain-containing protein [Sedimentisphaerales bacterium]|nr:ThuA domain-containing protein [Sedimentisphaerales bacterium]
MIECKSKVPMALTWVLTTLVVLLPMHACEVSWAESAVNENSRTGANPWVVYDGFDGPGKGKHIVLVSGDEEYRSEEALPQLGKILAKHHGFKCTVLFAIDPTAGTIDPDITRNIPGLEALRSADLMIIATRYRDLPDEQMKYVAEYLDAGKPVIGMRAAVVAFRLTSARYERFGCRSQTWKGGFGQQILGQTWMSHHGKHGRESTRGLIAPGMENHPIVRGCNNIWGPTDVYTVRTTLAEDSKVLVLGQVLEGMQPSDRPLGGPKNDPMMPIAWTRSYRGTNGTVGRVFTTTMGAATDLESEGLRRLLVNAAYWCVGLDGGIPDKANVETVGEYKPTPFGFGKYKKGMKPSDYALGL